VEQTTPVGLNFVDKFSPARQLGQLVFPDSAGIVPQLVHFGGHFVALPINQMTPVKKD
jgi:hypothetical protein